MAATQTILLITSDRIARADMSGSSRPRLDHLWQAEATDIDLVSAAESALLLGTRRVKRVWVIAADAWTQTIPLPPRAVAGLKPDQVAQALAFEAETHSGISAGDSSIGYRDLGMNAGERHYWYTQTSSHELRQLDDAARRSGGRLMGVVHPTGLENGQAPSIDAPAAHGGDWTAAHRETLSDDAALRGWITRCAATLAASKPAVPIVTPAPRPISARGRSVLTAVAVALAVALCAAHFTLLQAQLREAENLADGARAHATEMAKIRKQIRDAEREAETAKADVGMLEAQLTERRSTRAAHRRRWSVLLARLATHCDGDVMVERIEARGAGFALMGVCLRPSMADDLATRLAADLAPLGWRVQPPITEALLVASDGGPWTFELVAVDAPVASLPDEPAEDAGAVAHRDAPPAREGATP